MSKRLFDLFFALLGIIIGGLLLLILYILASIDTKQNGIFSQKRIERFLSTAQAPLRQLSGTALYPCLTFLPCSQY